MLRKNIFAAITALGSLFLLSSCGDETSPGWEYMPDMYRGPALEAYQPYMYGPDSMSALLPVQGTVPRGFMTYKSFPNTPEGYELAKANMKMPANLPTDSVTLFETGKLYGIYCGQCHGEKGDGQGVLVKNEKILGVPSYADRQITPGSIFHVVTYGKGIMGSHASQVTPYERWLLARHVMKLRGELTGESAPADTAAANTQENGQQNAAGEEEKEEIKQS